MSKDSHARFVEKGNTIVMRQDKPDDFVMDDRELIVQILQLEQSLDKFKTQIPQLEENIRIAKENTKVNSERLKELKKFEEKMTTIQESKAKNIFDEFKDKCRKEVEEEYKDDNALTPFENGRQRWRIYQNKIGTCERSGKELAPSIMKKMYYAPETQILDDPWKDINNPH